MGEEKTYSVRWYEVGKQRTSELLTVPTSDEIGEKYSEKQAGRSMCNFMLENCFVETGIGEKQKERKTDLTCIGAVLEQSCCGVGRVFVAKDIEIGKRREVKPVGGFQAVYSTGEVYEWGGEQHNKLLELYENLIENERYIAPVSIGQYVLMINDQKRLEVGQPNKVSTINWKIEQEKNEDGTEDEKLSKVRGYIMVDGGPKLRKLYFSDFGKKWCPDCIRILGYDGLQETLGYTEMTDYGVLRPIEFRLKDGASIIIDNVYIYLKQNGNVNVIGYWDNGKLLVKVDMIQSQTSQVRKLFERVGIYINKLRFLIAPWSTIDTKVTEVLEG